MGSEQDETTYMRDRAEELRWRAEARGLSRREILKIGAAAVPLAALATAPRPVQAQVVRAVAPKPTRGSILKPIPSKWFVDFDTNAEMRWDAIGRNIGYRIPNSRFFVRNHSRTPRIDPSTYGLRVFGSGLTGEPGRDSAVSFGLDELTSMPAETRTVALECAGNGRSFYDTQQGKLASGTEWKLGAIGVARWRGVPLSEVLERAGIEPDAVDVMPEGLDPNYVDDGDDLGRVRRPLPVGKALDDALVAYEMNGEALPLDHGFPVRLIVPGWIGIASIKWLGALEVSKEPLFSPWNTDLYRFFGPEYPKDSPPLRAQRVKSAFELPFDAKLKAGEHQRLRGRSWSGRGRIEDVEISTDGGESWKPARLRDRNRPQAWRRWDFDWTPGKGKHVLIARATDDAGRTQPKSVPFNDKGYLFWAAVRHQVSAA